MSKYLLTSNGFGRVVEVDNALISADDWGEIERAFAWEAHGGKFPKSPWDKYANATSLYPDQVTPNGIPYDWGLAGPGGAWYTLLCFAEESAEKVAAAKDWIRRSFDVVRFSVQRVTLLPVTVDSPSPSNSCGLFFGENGGES